MTVRNGGGDGQQLPATSSSVTVTTEAALANTTPASFLSEYLQKWRGANEAPLPRESLRTLVISWSGAFIAILVLAVLDQYAGPPLDFNFLIAPLGASAVLMFGVPAVKLSQPRNVIGGHSLSALVGILVRLVLQPQYGGGRANFVASALGMSLGLTAMQATGTTHPPAGATALIAASVQSIGDWRGFKFLLTAAVGSSIMVLVALMFNNLVPGRRYPTYW